MSIYDIANLPETLAGNTYPGRGIVIGKSEDGKHAVSAYFIMGRSENSRNRVFTEKDGAIFTEPHDYAKVSDPSLIIYAAVREYQNKLIVTNGDQTDTIYEYIKRGFDMRAALRTREFEPDAPNLRCGTRSFHSHLRNRRQSYPHLPGRAREGSNPELYR